MMVVAGVAQRDLGDDQWVLAARRRDCGLWEFPGGKIEPGESERQALVREWREEFDISISVRYRLPVEVEINTELQLVSWLIEVDEDPRPGPDHDLVDWVPISRWPDLSWTPADIAVCKYLETYLGTSASVAGDTGQDG